MERALPCAKARCFRAEDLPDNILYLPEKPRHEGTAGIAAPLLRKASGCHIERVLQETSGNKKLAARILGIDLSASTRKMEKLGMPAK